jgi:hypothetical protein
LSDLVGVLTGLVKPSTDTARGALHRYKAVALESKPDGRVLRVAA